MPSMLKLLPAGLAAVLLAGCGGSTGSPSGAAPPAAITGIHSPPAGGGIDSPPPGGGIDSAPGGDRRGTTPTPTAPANVPGACSLITQADLTSVTHDLVTLLFDGDPSEDPPHLDLATGAGATSSCHQLLHSKFAEKNLLNTDSGEVTVRIQSGGADIYFPPRAGDQPVAGIGDEAMARNYRLYVRLGTGVLFVEVAITSSIQDPNRQYEQDLTWAKKIASIVIGRL